MLPAARPTRATPLEISDIHGPFLRMGLVMALPAAALTSLIAFWTQDVGMLALAIGSWAATAMAMIMIHLGRENAVLFLGSCALGSAVGAWLSDIAALKVLASLAIVFVGAAAVMFMRGRAIGFLVMHTAFLFGVHFLWHGIGWRAFTEGLLTSIAFLASSVGMRWIRDRSMDSASRFLNLFERAPVSLWEEDFSRVGEWLDQLRADGVTDLAAYLADNPAAFRYGMSLVEVVRVNREAARFLEVDDPKELTGPLKPETFPDDALPSMLAQFEAIWNGDDHVTIEVRRGFTVQGNPLDGLLHWAVPRRFGEPDLSRVIVSVVDVTAISEARRSLEQSLKSRDELIATVSHEIRTPLTTVVGLSTELGDHFDDFGRDEAKELLRMVSEQSVEVATIVEDLLVAARTESGSLKVIHEPVDLHLEAKATLRGLDIEHEVDCHTIGVIPTVYGDAGRVRQILRNLLVNARRYGALPVRVVVFATGDEVRLEVRDRGNPIPEGERDLIFDRYYRSRQLPGITASAGLGLTVSRDLARLMGGDLAYQHDGESVFTLVLPRPDAGESAATA
ncbi:MAG: HAMP domain-containing sensor histidine kinase [Acidimicrobiia bacterium]|nr:HAMP domain-containing sensor histidine kinase [Acidimicrobiia bacterium]